MIGEHVSIMSGEISNRRVTHLRGDDIFRLDVEEKIERRTPEVFRVISDGVRGLTK